MIRTPAMAAAVAVKPQTAVGARCWLELPFLGPEPLFRGSEELKGKEEGDEPSQYKTPTTTSSTSKSS